MRLSGRNKHRSYESARSRIASRGVILPCSGGHLMGRRVDDDPLSAAIAIALSVPRRERIIGPHSRQRPDEGVPIEVDTREGQTFHSAIHL